MRCGINIGFFSKSLGMEKAARLVAEAFIKLSCRAAQHQGSR